MERLNVHAVMLNVLVLLLAFGASAAGAAKPASDPADACKGGGWESLTHNGGAHFKNQGHCVTFVRQGGTFATATETRIDLPVDYSSSPGYVAIHVSVFVPNSSERLTGTVDLTDGSSSCVAPLTEAVQVGGSGTCSLVAPPSGPYTVSATYSGDSTHAPSSTSLQLVAP